MPLGERRYRKRRASSGSRRFSMMFAASKLLAFALEPLFWVLIPLAAGVLLQRRRPRLGHGLASAALLALVLSTWTPLPLVALHDLETRFPPPPADTDMRQFVGVVVLGGALSRSEVWVASGQVALNEHAERMTTAVALARKHPHLKLMRVLILQCCPFPQLHTNQTALEWRKHQPQKLINQGNQNRSLQLWSLQQTR